MAALDASKVFIRVNNYGLFLALMIAYIMFHCPFTK